MKKSKPKKYDEKLFIGMSFSEAAERFAGVAPAEMHANIEKAKKKKKPPRSEPLGGKVVNSNVVLLRNRRKVNNV
ncbi:hypothetical protein [Tardiphaga sp. OK245]|uniref:hypothetical protein n=1 Tax=Tardiphaga sp. OK245 TaxID=1855306 RepID=UPI0008A76237|nr:hypothetical protein [Tardiphaga sp. OK245]SEI04735.1 hypothetical protein SAMN05216367_3231 [Tardiphaga sp. OK245]